MAEIHGRLRPLFACHVIQRAGPQPHPGMLTPTPPGSSCLGAAHGRHMADCRSQPVCPASTTAVPRPAPFVHADLKRE